MSQSLIRAISSRKNQLGFGFFSRFSNSRHFHSQWPITTPKCSTHSSLGSFVTGSRRFSGNLIPELNHTCLVRQTNGFCSVSLNEVSDSNLVNEGDNIDIEDVGALDKKKPVVVYKKPIDFTKIDAKLLPTVMIIGRPNVGKSALYNRLIRRREALVYNTPDDHVTRDIREGIAKLGDLRFNVLDSAGIETEVSSGTILGRTTSMTANVLARTQFAVLIIDVRAGLHPLDLEVGKWLRKHAPQIKPIVVMNKSESIGESLAEVASEALALGFGEPTAISAETGLGMTALYEVLHPLLEDYMVQTLNDRCSQDDVTSDENLSEEDESKLPLQLAIVGRPNVGKSTLLNALLEEERVLVGPEAGLTRDAVRVQFEFQGRTVYMVDTAGWLERTERDKGPASLSIMQSRKSLMRAHIVALVLDAEEIIKSQRSMTHSEVVIARRAVEEGRGLVVIVNKMDCLRGKQNSEMYKKIKEAVPIEVQTVIPQITGIPVVFISALEGRGRLQVMNEVIGTYERWCSRLSTGRLNRWLIKVMSRHSWKDFASQPKIKFFTQVKARPPTFVAFLTGKTQLLESDIRFLTKSLKDDFDLGGTPIRIIQRSVLRTSPSGKSSGGTANRTGGPARQRTTSDKRTVSV
ncbi:GTPase Der [Brassica napus]|uniref:GTPase Der n=1 Tax=Brassica napus TaxID=3708 RepID=UPI00207A35E9|nr:GTPase Der [Brassica napus]